MDCHEKEALKKSLANPAHIFTDSELQQIINQFFFDDEIAMDSELVAFLLFIRSCRISP